ncbi:undecaprenyl-diphosphate phosphatase [candidate division WOR-3 bacterium]|nr:undecaprenyl-diphosphate phosphatase [candidate division WOR-3 bacterium]
MHDVIISIIFGFLEGLTEFIPVSSTGHLIIAEFFLPFKDREFAQAFEVIIQFGAILSVVFLYRRRFIGLVRFHKSGFYGKRAFFMLLLTSLPALIFGALFHSLIKTYLFNPLTVSFALVAGGLLMYAAERFSKKFRSGIDSLTYRDAFVFGLFQVLSLFPGMSRSACTISGGMLRKFDVRTSAEYSFIAAVPVMTAATLFDAIKSTDAISRGLNALLLIVGFVTSFFVAALSIKMFMAILSKTSLKYFAIYRIIIGASLAFLIFLGILDINL